MIDLLIYVQIDRRRNNTTNAERYVGASLDCGCHEARSQNGALDTTSVGLAETSEEIERNVSDGLQGLIVVISVPVFLIHCPLSVTRDRPPVDEHLPRLPQLLLLAQTARPVHISSHSLYMILQGWAGTRIL